MITQILTYSTLLIVSMSHMVSNPYVDIIKMVIYLIYWINALFLQQVIQIIVDNDVNVNGVEYIFVIVDIFNYEDD